jgi:hypothetical protein
VKYGLRFTPVVRANQLQQQLYQQLELIVLAMATFTVTLLENPRQQFRLFYRAVVAAYGAACTTIHEHGLLGYIVNDTQWQLLPGNNVIDPDLAVANIILPRPSVVIPPTPAATAGALTIKVWERKLADNIAVSDNLRTLKAQLIASIQPADLVILHDPFFGLLNVSAFVIMAHVTVLHGTLDHSDFAHLRSQLLISMTHKDSLPDFIGTHQLLHAQFAESQQPLSELDKCHHFREAVKTQAHVQHAIDSYLVAHPLVGEQTFLALIAHVVEQAPNFAPTIASMGYAANGTLITHDQSPPDPSLTILSSPAFSALLTAAVKAAHPPTRKNSKRAAVRSPPPRTYCFHHGYDGHNSADCRHMLAHAFPSDQRAAVTHTAIVGASTNRL